MHKNKRSTKVKAPLLRKEGLGVVDYYENLKSQITARLFLTLHHRCKNLRSLENGKAEKAISIL